MKPIIRLINAIAGTIAARAANTCMVAVVLRYEPSRNRPASAETFAENHGVGLSPIGRLTPGRSPKRLPVFAREFPLPLLVALAFALAPLSAQEEPSKAEGDQQLPHFNGRDLDGWRIVDKFVFDKHGKVLEKDGVVSLGAGRPGTAIAWTRAVPRNRYELTLEARRVAGDDFFCGLTFPVDDSHCTLILGGWGGQTTGLSNLNNFSAIENETTNAVEFQQGRWYRVRLRVTPERVSAWVDDREIVDIDRRDKKFSVWWEQEPVRPLGIATWNTTAELRKLQVKRLAKDD